MTVRINWKWAFLLSLAGMKRDFPSSVLVPEEYNQDGTNEQKTHKVGVMFPSETLYALVPWAL